MIDINLVNNLFNVANIAMLIASFPLIYAVFKNRNILKGYSVWGTLGTVFGLLAIDIAYFYMANWASLALSATTDVYWVLALTFSIKAKVKA